MIPNQEVRSILGLCLHDNSCLCARNKPFPSYLQPPFQSKAKCEAIHMKMIFHSHANKTHFHNKGFVFNPASKGSSLTLLLAFTKSFAWLVSRVVGV